MPLHFSNYLHRSKELKGKEAGSDSFQRFIRCVSVKNEKFEIRPILHRLFIEGKWVSFEYRATGNMPFFLTAFNNPLRML